MTLHIETSRALRTHDQLAALVRAVVSAAPSDESRAVEWKLGYSDLTSNEASFALARAILGFANRMPAVAGAQFEGVAYVVVGAEPGKLQGQTVPDSAEVANSIGRFVGQGYPLWDGRVITVGEEQVFVIIVEPPRPGDRIALLQKSFQPLKGALVQAGTIFARQPGKTERATKEEIDLLQNRLVAGAADESHTQEIRRSVDALAGASKDWTGTMFSMISAAYQRDSAWTESDLIEWVDTDSGVRQRELVATIAMSRRQIRLLTTETSLIDAVAALENHYQRRDAWAYIAGRAPFTDASRALAATQLDEVRKAATLLEQAAVLHLAR